jgi:glycosyltransferase involved in cell wall biosynthesis
MIIGFDAKRVFNNKTGLGNYSRRLLQDLHCNWPNPQMRLFTPKIQCEADFLFHQSGVKRVLPQGKWKHLSSLWRSFGQAEIAKKEGVTIFHGLSNEIPSGLAKQGIAGVVTIHDLIFLHRPELYPRIDRGIYRHKFEQACKQAQLVLATSEATKQDIIRFFKLPESKVQVLYQDGDPAYSKPIANQEKERILAKYQINNPFILSVGTFEKRKNHLRLLEAFHQLDRLDLDLVLIGRAADNWPMMMQFIEKHKLQNRVKVISTVAFHELVGIYQSASVFAYVSEIEGFGIPVLEAMKAGIPVLTSNCSSMPEVAGKAGVLVNPKDVSAIQSGLASLLEPNGIRNKIIQEIPLQLRLFDGNNIAKQLLAYYHSL